MSLPKRYNPKTAEPALQTQWQADGTYHFNPTSDAPVFSIDTPPPSVSGHLHLGHVYSYSQTDFIARFFRMNGRNLFYPMGFDDNGLPTERLVERREGVRAADIGRQAFIELCLKVSEETEGHYKGCKHHGRKKRRKGGKPSRDKKSACHNFYVWKEYAV